MARTDLLKDNSGTALVIVVLVLVALAGLVMGISAISVNETQLATNEMLDKQVFYLAEGGVEKSIQYLSQLAVPFLGSGPNNDQPVKLFDNLPLYGKGTITSYLDPLDSNTGNPTRFVAITVRATLNNTGITKCLQVKVGQQNFSRYAYFSDLEKSPSGYTIWFVTRDVFYGPVHTNDQMHIYGSPTFYEEVSSAASSIDYYHGGPPQDDPQFHKGITLNASTIPLPVNTNMLLNKANEPGGLKLDGNPVRIRFMVDASENPFLRVTINGSTQDMSYPSNGVIYVNGEAQVEGVVKGYEKKLQLEGVGFRAEIKNNDLVLNVGFSHPVLVKKPEGIDFSVEKNIITVSGIDKQKVGEVAAKIRKIRPPEPYKGKGIRYVGEQVRKKLGKKAVASSE